MGKNNKGNGRFDYKLDNENKKVEMCFSFSTLMDLNSIVLLSKGLLGDNKTKIFEEMFFEEDLFGEESKKEITELLLKRLSNLIKEIEDISNIVEGSEK